MGRRLKHVGTYPLEIPALGIRVEPGQEFDVDDDAIAADLARRQDTFEVVSGMRRTLRDG